MIIFESVKEGKELCSFRPSWFSKNVTKNIPFLIGRYCNGTPSIIAFAAIRSVWRSMVTLVARGDQFPLIYIIVKDDWRDKINDRFMLREINALSFPCPTPIIECSNQCQTPKQWSDKIRVRSAYGGGWPIRPTAHAIESC